jgi:hypothetical protein
MPFPKPPRDAVRSEHPVKTPPLGRPRRIQKSYVIIPYRTTKTTTWPECDFTKRAGKSMKTRVFEVENIPSYTGYSGSFAEIEGRKQ